MQFRATSEGEADVLVGGSVGIRKLGLSIFRYKHVIKYDVDLQIFYLYENCVLRLKFLEMGLLIFEDPSFGDFIGFHSKFVLKTNFFEKFRG